MHIYLYCNESFRVDVSNRELRVHDFLLDSGILLDYVNLLAFLELYRRQEDPNYVKGVAGVDLSELFDPNGLHYGVLKTNKGVSIIYTHQKSKYRHVDNIEDCLCNLCVAYKTARLAKYDFETPLDLAPFHVGIEAILPADDPNYKVMADILQKDLYNFAFELSNFCDIESLGIPVPPHDFDSVTLETFSEAKKELTSEVVFRKQTPGTSTSSNLVRGKKNSVKKEVSLSRKPLGFSPRYSTKNNLKAILRQSGLEKVAFPGGYTPMTIMIFETTDFEALVMVSHCKLELQPLHTRLYHHDNKYYLALFDARMMFSDFRAPLDSLFIEYLDETEKSLAWLESQAKILVSDNVMSFLEQQFPLEVQ